MIILVFFLTLAFAVTNYIGNVTYDDLALKRCYNQWSIHGLWPEYNQTNWPQFCDPSRYKDLQPQTIAPFRDLMEKYWYVCDSYDDTENWFFWVHEWQKHGTCQPLPAGVYFRRTIDIFLEAQRINWYNCCSTGVECLIHINRSTYRWLGKC